MVIETGSHGSESFSGQGTQASGLRPVDSGQWTLWPVDSAVVSSFRAGYEFFILATVLPCYRLPSSGYWLQATKLLLA